MTDSVFAIAFGAGTALRFLKRNDPPVGEAKGYSRFGWTADRERAELFSSEGSAATFAAHNLDHDRFRIVPVPPVSRRPSPDGGTPILMRAAA